MTRKSERESDVGNDSLPVFYVIRLIEEPEILYLGVFVIEDVPTRGIFIFTEESYASEFIANCHPAPEEAEVVSSSEWGGILALLDHALSWVIYVIVDPLPVIKAPAHTIRISEFMREHLLEDTTD